MYVYIYTKECVKGMNVQQRRIRQTFITNNCIYVRLLLVYWDEVKKCAYNHFFIDVKRWHKCLGARQWHHVYIYTIFNADVELIIHIVCQHMMDDRL
jgi:hypothetical protein